jgi:AraC-like DNA-binding protein
MQLLALILFTAAIQGLFLAYLLVNRAASRENTLLAVLVAIMSVSILGPALGLSGYYRELPHLIRISDPIAFLLGPLLYGYIHLLTRSRLPWHYAWHLLPFGAYLVFLIPFYRLSGSEKIAFGEQILFAGQQPPQLVAIQILRTLHVGSYLMASLLLIRQFGRLLKENYSDIHLLTLDKAASLLRLYLVVSALGIGTFLFGRVAPINYVVANGIIGLGISLIIYALAYSLWNRPATPPVAQLVPPRDAPGPIVTEPAAREPLITSDVQPAPITETTQEKGRGTHYLSNEQYATWGARLEELLQRDRVYLEGELSLAQLGDRLGIQPYQASELISRRYGEPFFDLINRRRVEEVKKRLEDPAYAHYSILGIALDCGFNSKSSFNAAFKKFTGFTPSQYRNVKETEDRRRNTDFGADTVRVGGKTGGRDKGD